MQYHQCAKSSTKGTQAPATDDNAGNNSATLRQVEEAISDRKDLWIAYDMESHSKGPRKITPLSVTKNDKGHLLEALCQLPVLRPSNPESGRSQLESITIVTSLPAATTASSTTIITHFTT
jgi:hypothetical protein